MILDNKVYTQCVTYLAYTGLTIQHLLWDMKTERKNISIYRLKELLNNWTKQATGATKMNANPHAKALLDK